MEVFIMADKRDFRLRVDLTFPPEVKQYAEQIRGVLVRLYTNAVIIHPGESNEENGFIDIERCGHRLDLACDKIARWEVDRGQVFP